MLHIVTVHWQDPGWIKLQCAMLAKMLSGPFKTYAWLTGIEARFNSAFDYVHMSDQDPSHEDKLDILASVVVRSAKQPSDQMLFIDGDAYPIAHLTAFLNTSLENYDLVAIERLENLGERQPHPCFCAMSIETWTKYKCTWTRGYRWINVLGKPKTDVGGNLLQIVNTNNLKWRKMHRNNTINLHPVFFGIYDGVIYHHGAGFRNKGNPLDYYRLGDTLLNYRIRDFIFRRLPPTLEKLLYKSWFNPRRKLELQADQKNRLLAIAMRNSVTKNPVDPFQQVEGFDELLADYESTWVDVINKLNEKLVDGQG